MRLKVVLSCLAAAVLAVPSAFAERPVREPAPFADATGTFCEDFDVLVHAVVNREMFTAFSDGRGLVTGTFKVALTNLETGKTITVNVSGPVFFPSDGSSVVLRGRTLLFGEAGDFGPGSPPTLKLVSGVVVVSLPNVSVSSIQGPVTDLCEALA
jgi:hypothetical protein